MTDDRLRMSAAWSAFALLLCITLYLLSYAPVYRLVEGPDVSPPSGGFSCYSLGTFDQRPWESIYLPVMLLMDHTSLDRPLLAWADLWDVAGTFKLWCSVREIERELSRSTI